MIYIWFSAFLLHNLAGLLPLYPVLVAGAAGLTIVSSVRPRYHSTRCSMLATIAISAYILTIDFMREGAWASPANIVRLLTPLVALVIDARGPPRRGSQATRDYFSRDRMVGGSVDLLPGGNKRTDTVVGKMVRESRRATIRLVTR